MRRWILILAAWPGLVPSPARGGDVRSWTEAYLHPELGGPGVAPASPVARFGHLELDLAGARLYPVLVAGEVCGVFVEGPASFRYRVDDPKAASLWRYNVDKASDYEVDDEGAIGDEVEDALIMLSGGAQDLLGEPEQGAADPPEEEVAKAFRDHLERWGRDWTASYVDLLPEARVDPPPDVVAVVEMDGDKHDVHLVCDPMRGADEDLEVMRDIRSDLPGVKNTRYGRRLAVQPLGRQRLDPRPFKYRVVALDAEITNPRGRDVEVAVRERVQAVAPVRVLDFDLDSWVLGETGISGAPDSLEYRLLAVKDDGGRDLVWRHGEGDLLVELPRALEPGEEIDLGFVMAGDILYNPGGNSYWRLSGAWWPEPRGWAQEAFSYHAVVKAASDFVPFSNGRTVRRWKEGELSCGEFEESFPVDLPEVLAGKYRTYSDSRDGLTINVSSYAFANESSCRTVAKLVRGCIEFYEPLLGDYPYPELNVIEIASWGWGQAPDAMVLITGEAFESGGGVIGINRRVAHEVAHAWWGGVGKLGDPEDQWLSESTAEYYSAVAMGSLIDEREAKRAVREWEIGAHDAKDVTSVYLANFVSGKDGDLVRQQLLYCKGPLVLDALRREVGDQVFFTILKSLLTSFRGKPLRTRDLIGITEYITKRQWDDWFDRYLFGLEVPESH